MSGKPYTPKSPYAKILGDPPKPPRGRPSKFTPELGSEFCRRVASGRLISDVCRDDDMPTVTTIQNWQNAHESFLAEYIRARQLQADEFAAETVRLASSIQPGTRTKKVSYANGRVQEEVVTTDAVERARLMVETRKWIISKLFPRKYGEHVEDAPAVSGINEMFEALRNSNKGAPDLDGSE